VVTVKVNVTKKDIGTGICSDPGNCPIARAILRITDKSTAVSVGNDSIEFYSGESFERDYLGTTKTPKVADHFISDFDTRIAVKPFSFKLRVPNKAAKLFRKSAIATA